MSDKGYTFGTFGPIYQKSESVRRWLGMVEGQPLLETLRDWRQQTLTTMRTAKEPVDLYRAQGKLEVIDRLIGLREELNDRVMESGTGKASS